MLKVGTVYAHISLTKFIICYILPCTSLLSNHLKMSTDVITFHL